MIRKGPAYPGIGDWLALAIAGGLSLALLFSGPAFRAETAASLRATVFYPFGLVMAFVPAPINRTAQDHLERHQEALCQLDRSQWREAMRENDRLRELLGFAQRAEQTLLPTQVVGRSADRFGEILALAGGAKAGASVGQPVVGVEGLVGVVALLEENLSHARTLRHDGLAISGMLQDSRFVGRLRWNPRRHRLDLNGIPLHGRVRPGEWVVTSGYGGIFPRGIPIGEVVAVADDSTNVVKEIGVRPFVDLDRTEEVFLLGTGPAGGSGE